MIEKQVEEALRKFKVEITDPFSSSQCGYPGLEGYCRRRRLLNHFKPENIEENEDLQMVFLKGYFTELAYKNIIRDIYEERVFTNLRKPWSTDGIRVDPDIWIPSLKKIIEIKATRRIPEKPFEHHRIQVGLQIKACPVKNPIAEIHYIEWEGRRWNMKVFKMQPLSDEEYKKIVEENKVIKWYWERKQIPPIPEEFNHYRYPCYWGRGNRCPHWDDCWLVEKDAKEILVEDIETYYKVKMKIRELNSAIKRLQEYADKLEKFLPKEQGIYRIKDYILKVNIIPETIVPQYKKKSYIKYTVKKAHKQGVKNEGYKNT